jgi:tetratricopeptide (TPR) repeat protein
MTGRLALPVGNQDAPYFGVASIENESPTARAAGTARDAPPPGIPAMATLRSAPRGWRGGTATVANAETSYRAVLAKWPANDRAMNNLGNVLAMQGRFDEALALYDQAMKLRPRQSGPFFNASQVHTRRFEYREASELVSRAAALDFDLVKAYQNESIGGDLPLADQWLEPRTFWTTLVSAEAAQARIRSCPRPGAA